MERLRGGGRVRRASWPSTSGRSRSRAKALSLGRAGRHPADLAGATERPARSGACWVCLVAYVCGAPSHGAIQALRPPRDTHGVGLRTASQLAFSSSLPPTALRNTAQRRIEHRDFVIRHFVASIGQYIATEPCPRSRQSLHRICCCLGRNPGVLV